VRIQIPDGGPPFEAELVQDSFTMVWLHQTNSRRRRIGVRVLLSAALKIGGAHRACVARRTGRCSRRTGSGAGGFSKWQRATCAGAT
jgi:rhodanese-related sulfurtransferase